MRWPDAHPFTDPRLLEEALTHASWSHEHGGPDNERLEFLGDAVLQLAVSRLLVQAYPGSGEGSLSRMRQQLVNTRALAEVARSLDLGPSLRLGVGEDQSGGRARDRVLAGGVEALLGAVFLDAGFTAAADLVATWTHDTIPALAARPDGGKDARSLLQERTQQQTGAAPTYAVVDRAGPDHAPRFDVEVRLGEVVLGRGQGATKREASRRAAQEALQGRSEPAEGDGG
jgi:ribonuclease-3